MAGNGTDGTGNFYFLVKIVRKGIGSICKRSSKLPSHPSHAPQFFPDLPDTLPTLKININPNSPFACECIDGLTEGERGVGFGGMKAYYKISGNL